MDNLEQRIIGLEILTKELSYDNAKLSGRIYTLENIIRSMSHEVMNKNVVSLELKDKCRRIIELYS